MKTPNTFRKWLVILGVAGCLTASAQTQTNKLRVGVYDSRAIAVAWANSTEFADTMKPVEAEFRQAKAAKNDQRMKEIDEQMKSRQRRAHEQAFSTGSVAAIMDKVKDRLPDVARQADVQLIISKWELNHHAPGVELVEVTDKIVALFHVSERGLKWCQEIQQKAPLAPEKIPAHKD